MGKHTFDATDIEQNKLVAALAYVIFFIPLLAAPESKFGKFHANQGLLLLLVSLVVSIVIGFFPFIGFMFSWIWSLVVLAVVIMCFINAYNGKAEELPLIGHITILK